MQNETNADEMNDNELNELKMKIWKACDYYDVIRKMVQKDAHVITKVAYKHFTRVSCPDEH